MNIPYLYIKIRIPTEIEEPEPNNNYLLIEYTDEYNKYYSRWFTPAPNKDNPFSFRDKLYDWSAIEGPWLYEDVYGTGMVNEKTADGILVQYNKEDYKILKEKIINAEEQISHSQNNDIQNALTNKLSTLEEFKEKFIQWFFDKNIPVSEYEVAVKKLQTEKLEQDDKIELRDELDYRIKYEQGQNEQRILTKKYKKLSKLMRARTRKLGDYSEKDFISRCDKYRHLTSGKLNFKKIAEEEFGVHADTVKNEIIDRKLSWLIDDSAKYVDNEDRYEECNVCGKSKIVDKECPHSHPK